MPCLEVATCHVHVIHGLCNACSRGKRPFGLPTICAINFLVVAKEDWLA
jgi:hypothetical protein